MPRPAWALVIIVPSSKDRLANRVTFPSSISSFSQTCTYRRSAFSHSHQQQARGSTVSRKPGKKEVIQETDRIPDDGAACRDLHPDNVITDTRRQIQTLYSLQHHPPPPLTYLCPAKTLQRLRQAPRNAPHSSRRGAARALTREVMVQVDSLLAGDDRGPSKGVGNLLARDSRVA